MAGMSKIKWQTDDVMSVVTTPPRTFTLDEWRLNNLYRYRCSLMQREVADCLILESQQIHESAEKVKTNKEKSDHFLKEKVGDIEFLIEELLDIRKDILLETDALLIFKKRIINSLEALRRNALEVCGKCLIAREHRLGIDLVQDKAQKELRKECEVIKRLENLLVRVLEQTQEQIRRLKSTHHQIDQDLEEKENNLRIEKHNLNLKETSYNISICHRTPCLNPSIVTLNDWVTLTRKNIISAAKEINTARPLRSYINSTLQQVINDLKEQKNATDEALKRQIGETREAKFKLELEHSEIIRQAHEITRNITNIEKSIAKKEDFVALAHTRMRNRFQRPGLESTTDRVETSLTEEVIGLREIIPQLRQKLCKTKACLRYLLKTQIQLEEDINIKTNTLRIDEVDCVSLRQSLNYHAY